MPNYVCAVHAAQFCMYKRLHSSGKGKQRKRERERNRTKNGDRRKS